MTLTAHQVREACELLAWTPLMLAERALINLDEAAAARDEDGFCWLGGLQLGQIHRALEAAGIEFITKDGSASVRLRKREVP